MSEALLPEDDEQTVEGSNVRTVDDVSTLVLRRIRDMKDKIEQTKLLIKSGMEQQ